MADDDLDHSISLALQQVGCPSVTLKAEQRACIKSVYDGKDVFLWLPTGFGKSLCYEVLPFVLGRKLDRKNCLVIVVSPLVSLMNDQVQSLRRRSVECAILSYGTRVDKEYETSNEDLRKSSLLFCAPEAIDMGN
jgi:superfamily II DNA helicase RecQ